MGIRFLGTPIEQFDRLCIEEEIVKITISCFKREEIGHPDGSTTMEEVRTGDWGMQIKSSKDILQFVDDDDNDSHPNSGKSKNNKDEEAVEAKEVFVRKYSTDIPLAEQIKIGGRGKFLQIIDGKPVLNDSIDLSQEKGIILKPHQSIGSTLLSWSTSIMTFTRLNISSNWQRGCL